MVSYKVKSAPAFLSRPASTDIAATIGANDMRKYGCCSSKAAFMPAPYTPGMKAATRNDRPKSNGPKPV